MKVRVVGKDWGKRMIEDEGNGSKSQDRTCVWAVNVNGALLLEAVARE